MTHPTKTPLGAFVLLAALSMQPPAFASAQDAPDCSTPRRAMQTWLANLQPDQNEPEVAAACFDWAGARITGRAERHRLARRLKQVLDARGLYVQMSELPDEREIETTEVLPFDVLLPELKLVRLEGRWVIAASTLAHVDAWHADTFSFDIARWVAKGPAWLLAPVLGVQWWQLIGLLLIGIVALLVRWAIVGVVARQGTRVLTRVVKTLDAPLLERAAKPVGTLAVTVAAAWIVPSLGFSVNVNRVLLFALRVAAAVSAVIVAYRLVDVFADVMAKRAEATETKLDDQLVPLVRKSLKVVTVVLGVIFVLQNLQVDVASLIAGASLGGLAFTLAARDTVANFFGSISIFADQPFQVGDWVKVEGVEGVVEEVGMRSTRVRTFYRSLVTIPNSKVADGVIDNFGARDSRRCFIKLGLQYDTTAEQMEAFCEGARAVLATNEHVKDDYYVYFSGFADSALEVMLYFFFDVATWDEELRHRHNIYLELLRVADALGVQYAFPTRTLHIASQTEPQPPVVGESPSVDELRARVYRFAPGGTSSRPNGPEITHGFHAGHGGQWADGAKRDGGNDPDADVADSR